MTENNLPHSGCMIPNCECKFTGRDHHEQHTSWFAQAYTHPFPSLIAPICNCIEQIDTLKAIIANYKSLSDQQKEIIDSLLRDKK